MAVVAAAAFRRCFSAHSRLASRDLSAAWSLASFARTSLSDRSFILSDATLLSRT